MIDINLLDEQADISVTPNNLIGDELTERIVAVGPNRGPHASRPSADGFAPYFSTSEDRGAPGYIPETLGFVRSICVLFRRY